MKILKTINVMLCSLLLTFFLVFIGLRVTMFNGDYLIRSADKSDYYSALAKEMNSSIQDIGMASNIPKGVLTDVVSINEVKEAAQQYFSTLYLASENQEIAGDQVVDRAVEKVTAYSQANGIAVNDLSQFSSYVNAAFIQSVQLPYMTSFGQKVSQYSSYLKYVLIGSFGLFVFALFMLVVPLSKYPHQLYRSLSYVFSSVGLLLVLFPAVVLLSGVLKRLAINAQSLYNLFNAYVSGICMVYILLGVLCLIISLGLAVISEQGRKRLVQSRKRVRGF